MLINEPETASHQNVALLRNYSSQEAHFTPSVSRNGFLSEARGPRTRFRTRRACCITAGHLQDASSLGFVSFVVGHFPDQSSLVVDGLRS